MSQENPNTEPERTASEDPPEDGGGTEPTDPGGGGTSAARDEAEDAGEPDGGTDGSTVDPDRLRRGLNYAVLAGLVLLAFVAAVQFYLNASATIGRWVAPQYRSAFQAAFNLAVFLLAAAGVIRQSRRIG